MKRNNEKNVQTIIHKVATNEVDIIGNSIVDILVKNNFSDDKIELTNDEGGYDLPSSEFIIEIVTLMISFSTFGLELYDRIKDSSKFKDKVNSQEEKITALQEEISRQRSDYNRLLLEKQLEICREILKIKSEV
jgi:hypothetical protein